jgi:hypothetical protein
VIKLHLRNSNGIIQYFLQFSCAPQLSQDVPSEAGFLRDNPAVLRDRIKETPCIVAYFLRTVCVARLCNTNTLNLYSEAYVWLVDLLTNVLYLWCFQLLDLTAAVVDE